MDAINDQLNRIRAKYGLRKGTTIVIKAGIAFPLGYYAPWQDIWCCELNDNEAKP